jgi:serine/threonine protein kinase
LDYCPGGDLGKMLAKKGKLDEELVRIYIAEIILAIQYLHKREIIFRDLKPDNIVID